MKKISLNEPNFFGNEKRYLTECIKTNWVSGSGKFVKKFENEVCKALKAKYATGIINGTCALDLALKVLGCGSESEIILPTLTFIAPVNSVIYNQCYPVFMDSDNYFNIDEKKILKFLEEETFTKNNKTYNKKTKRLIFAIIIVHVWGNAVKLDNIVKYCKKRNIKIIEDASESFGTKYTYGKFKNKYTGTIGDIGCMSFNTNKIITCGSGGMLLTNNKKYYDKAFYLSNQAKDNSITYIHNDVGYNYRLNNLNAAVGMAQLENFKTILINKNNIYKYYKRFFKNSKNITVCDTPSYSKNNHWMVLINFKNKKQSLEKIVNTLSKKNIEVRPVWHLNHLQKKFRKFQSYKIIKSIYLQKNSLCIPSSSSMKVDDLKYVSKILMQLYG